jgi:hypothetical protein
MAALDGGAEGWGRRRLLASVAGVVVVALGVLVGLGYAVRGVIASTSATLDETVVAGTDLPSGQARRDAIAAAPMLDATSQDARGGTPAASPAPPIVVPAASRLGPAEVPTGFPHTSEGAVGQLAAIATTVLQAMSIERTRDVYARWSSPGTPAVEGWTLMAAVQGFLGSDAGPYVDRPGTSVVTVPAAAQVKGSDGDDWLVACVLLDVTVTVATQARAAYGYCERLEWDDDRWIVAPGAAPAQAPSTWPGTDLAAAAGWRTWTSEE